jgi:HAD superfamily hydrolase (TIGR01458 family)
VAHAETRGVIFDVDGVLEFHGQAFPGAAETVDLLRQSKIVIRLLTNSTLKSRRSCAERLRQQGIHVLDEEVITASYAAAHYLATLEPRSCWVMSESEGLEEFSDFDHDNETPEYIVIGDYRNRFDFEHLNRAYRLLLHGSKLIGMQSELADTSLGDPELNVGSWVGMLERASGVKATYIGKPSRYAFDLTLQTMGLAKEQVLMVGDKVSSDVIGAQGAGLAVALLRTGEFDARDLNDLDEAPNFVFDSIREVADLLNL